MTSGKILLAASISGALAVIIGAFGAHGLKPLLDSYQQLIFEKGVQYQFFHTLALAATGLAANNATGRNVWLGRASWFFLFGILFFSGSLYLLACRHLLPVDIGWIGPVTPLGGLCFIAGWILLGVGVANIRQSA